MNKKFYPCISHDGTKVGVWSGDDYVGLDIDFKGFFGDHYSYAWLSPVQARKLARKLLKYADKASAAEMNSS